ncbi:MAG: ECF RNA polymerase sigma factor SigL [Firmicutes bacterium ADurb.Bin419]|nr:MAG: ECF RNA polymerase sigma factor SigL [Firmicutes bacterium ADurb.Bin419]
MFDEDKLKQAHNGDLNAIEEICSSTWEAVYRFIYYKVQNRQEAEDITQETYVRALTHLQSSTVKIEKYVAFLKTVSLNVLRDKWRKKRRTGANIDLEAINPMEVSVEDTTEASAQRALIENALGSLNEEQRKVIELRIIKGYSTAECAKILSKKEGTIRVLQYRALKTLALILKKNGDNL